MSKWLSVVALLLGMAALAISVVVPGPTGANGRDGAMGSTGLQGPAGTNGTQGPAGPGTIMATVQFSGFLGVGVSCTNFAGAEVTIVVPGPGTVLVSGHVLAGTYHTFGTADQLNVFVGDSVSACPADAYLSVMFVAASEPTDYYYETVPVMHPYPVAAAGSYTYYVNGVEPYGGGDWFSSAALAAVFYPS